MKEEKLTCISVCYPIEKYLKYLWENLVTLVGHALNEKMHDAPHSSAINVCRLICEVFQSHKYSTRSKKGDKNNINSGVLIWYEEKVK